MVWPIAVRMVKAVGIDRNDAIWKYFFIGVFLVSTLGQPFFPFLGAQLIPCSAFASMTQTMGNALVIPMLPYMATDLIMTTLVMAIYLLFIKINPKIDLAKLQAIDPAMVEQEMPLPPANLQQKLYLWMVPIYLLLIVLPQFIKGNPVSTFFNTLSTMGITIMFVILFVAIRWQGKPLLDFKEVAYKQMNWGIFFMIAAAVYGANTLSADNTGVVAFLVQASTPTWAVSLKWYSWPSCSPWRSSSPTSPTTPPWPSCSCPWSSRSATSWASAPFPLPWASS